MKGCYRAASSATSPNPAMAKRTRSPGAGNLVVMLLPVMVLSGLTMSPAVTAAMPFLFDLFGGRQSARTIHFIVANLLVLFVLVHIVQVLVAGVFNTMCSMITGRYAIRPED